MPFSLGSYLLGVATVVGALAFGFGGGVLLTHTAMKENPAGQTRVERLARAESHTPVGRQASVAQINPPTNQAGDASDQVTTPDQDHPASVAAIKPALGQPPAVAPDPPAGTPNPDAARKPEEKPRQVQAVTEPPKPIKQAAREPQPPAQVEQSERTATTVESMEADRSAQRSRRYVEPRRYAVQPLHRGAPRTQRGLWVEDDPAQEVAISRPAEQRRFNGFGGFFGRPGDAND